MSMSPYDFADFIEHVKDKDFVDILETAERDCAATERASYVVKGARKARELGSTPYVKSLKDFLWFMRTQSKPIGASAYDFQLYKKVAEKLVSKGQWAPGALKLFD